MQKIKTVSGKVSRGGVMIQMEDGLSSFKIALAHKKVNPCDQKIAGVGLMTPGTFDTNRVKYENIRWRKYVNI